MFASSAIIRTYFCTVNMFNNNILYFSLPDSPLLSERKAKSFMNGRKRTGKIVTECCHNHCNMQIIESYCAPLHVHHAGGQTRTNPIVLQEKEQELENEQNNVVDGPPPRPQAASQQQSQDEQLAQQQDQQFILQQDVTVPELTQDFDTLSDQMDSLDESATNLLADAMPALMLADEVRETSEQRLISEHDEEDLPKDKVVTDMTELLSTHNGLLEEEEEEPSENSDRPHNINRTKGNSRTNRPSSRERNSRRKNSKEKKKNKAKSGGSRERKARRKHKSKNKKNRRRKLKHGQDHEDGYTAATDQLLTSDIDLGHPRMHVSIH